MKNENLGLMPSFGNSLFSCFSDSATDTADYALDNLSEAILTGDLKKYIPIIQDLPIINYFISAGKFMATVRDQMFLGKTLKFISELRKGTVNEDELERRKRALTNGEKWVYNEIKILITTLEQLDRDEKTKILAEIYRSYINREIDKETFDDFCSITERLFLSDILQLRVEYDYDKQIEENERCGNKSYAAITARYVEITGRLLAIGLMRASVKLSGSVPDGSDILNYDVSQKGKLYSEILSRIDFLGIGTRPDN